jgi:beta-lactamase regulating signal transducer with metallopeptidase domain
MDMFDHSALDSGMLDHLAGLLLSRLAWTSLQAAILVAVVALLIRQLPKLPAAARCMLWWLVAMQVLAGLCWNAPLEVPLLSPPAATRTITHDNDTAIATDIALPTDTGTADMTPAPDAAGVHATIADHWRLLLASLWLLALLAQIPMILRQGWRARALMRASRRTDDESMQALCARQADTLGLKRHPILRVSPDIDSPQVSGLWRPTILWPATHALSADESAMAIAHELAHLRRGDLWLGWLPAIAQRLFFFHPLVALAVREYALNREAACDAQVMQAGQAPQAYGHLLLRLGVAHPLPSGLAGASPSFRNLKRRLTMLQHTDSPRQRLRAWLLIALIAAIGVMPYRVTAAAGGTSIQDNAIVPPPPAPPLAPPPLPPVPPVSPPPPPPALPTAFGPTIHNVDIATENNAATGFALIESNSATIHGSDIDMAAVARLRAGNGESLLWVRNGDTGYVIRDPALIARAKAIQAPLTALVREQGKLADRQGEIAGREAELAAQEAGLAADQVAALAGQQAEELASRVASDASASALAEDARQAQALAAARSRLSARHADMQRELARHREAMARQRMDIARQDAALRQRFKALSAQNQTAMDKLVAEALAQGKAQKTLLR